MSKEKDISSFNKNYFFVILMLSVNFKPKGQSGPHQQDNLSTGVWNEEYKTGRGGMGRNELYNKGLRDCGDRWKCKTKSTKSWIGFNLGLIFEGLRLGFV